MTRPSIPLLIGTLLLLFPWLGLAQVNKPGAGFGVDATIFQGTVIKHTEKFHLPVPDLSYGLDINLQWKTYGKREWHQRRRYPVLGIGFAYTNYGMDSVYGRCFSIYPNIEIPLLRGKKLEWTLRIGDGVGFVTRAYARSKPSDTLNNAIGSKVNDYASFMTDIRYHVNDHWDVQVGLNFSHISNASYHQPNLGINLYGAHFGVKYFPTTAHPVKLDRKPKPLSNRWLAQARLSYAFTQSNAPLGPTYPVYLAALSASRRWLSKNKAFAGVDYSYHEGIYSFLLNNQFVPVGTERANAYKGAFFVGNEFLLGHLGVVLQVGYYFRHAYQTQGKIYQKIGGNLYLVQQERGTFKEVFLFGYLKTHTSVAELAEFGMGVGF